jgi:hypothetical protein
MTYTLDFAIPLGAGKAGLTDLRAQLYDSAGSNVGSAVSTGFFAVGDAGYHWSGSIPDSHRGGVKFYSNAASSVILAFAALNPEEAEYTDAKTSEAGGTDWTSDEREQIRDALGVTGDKTSATGGQLQDKSEPGDKMDLVDAPNAFALLAIQSGLATSTEIAALPDAAAVVDELWAKLVDGAIAFGELQTVILSILSGVSSGGGTMQLKFMGQDGQTERVIINRDANSNRLTVVFDFSDL